MTDDLVYRLRERARIRRQIPGRRSVEANEPDRIADLLDEAANALLKLQIERNEAVDNFTRYHNAASGLWGRLQELEAKQRERK